MVVTLAAPAGRLAGDELMGRSTGLSPFTQTPACPLGIDPGVPPGWKMGDKIGLAERRSPSGRTQEKFCLAGKGEQRIKCTASISFWFMPPPCPAFRRGLSLDLFFVQARECPSPHPA